METPLAWRNIVHRKLRTAVALAGVCFAIVLIFMQLGFYDVVFRASTMLLDQFEFDVALVSPHFAHLRAAGSLPRARLVQARAVPGVAAVSPLHVVNATWRSAGTPARRELPILAVDPAQPSFRLPALRRQAPLLKELDVALMDVRVQPRYGKVRAGMEGELVHRRVRVAGTYAYGSGFMADASIVVGDRTLFAAVPGTSREAVSLGLIRLATGARAADVMAELRRRLPADVEVWSRRQLETHEQVHFAEVKPLGLMFFAGVLLAFAVGAIILYQIMSAEVSNHLPEFATLLAMGYREEELVRVVLQQAGLFALLGFGPAAVMALTMYLVLGTWTQLPLVMTFPRLGGVLVLALLMCSLAGLVASRKLRRADPADLF